MSRQMYRCDRLTVRIFFRFLSRPLVVPVLWSRCFLALERLDNARLGAGAFDDDSALSGMFRSTFPDYPVCKRSLLWNGFT